MGVMQQSDSINIRGENCSVKKLRRGNELAADVTIQFLLSLAPCGSSHTTVICCVYADPEESPGSGKIENSLVCAGNQQRRGAGALEVCP